MEPFDLRWCVRAGETPCTAFVKSTDPTLPAEAVGPLRDLDAHARSATAFFVGLGLGEATSHPNLLLIANVAEPNARSITAADELGGCSGALRASSLCQGQGAILFGVRGGQIAADPDVVTHELAHTWTRPMLGEGRWSVDAAGSSDDPAILKEGLADFYAAVKSDDPVLGEQSARPADEARSLRVAVAFPEARTGFAHSDSLVLSSALWEAHATDKTAFVRALSHYLVRGVSPPQALAPWARGLADELDATAPALGVIWRRVADQHGLLQSERVLDIASGTLTRAYADTFIVPGRHDLPAVPLPRSVLQFRGDSPARGGALLSLRAAPRGERELEVVLRPGEPVDEATAPLSRAPFTRVGGRFEASIELPRGRYYLQIINRGEEAAWFDDLSVRPATIPLESLAPQPTPGADPPKASSPVSPLGLTIALVTVGVLVLVAARWLWLRKSG